MINVIDVTSKEILSGFHRGQKDIWTFTEIIESVCEGIIKEDEVQLNAPMTQPYTLDDYAGVLRIHFWGFDDSKNPEHKTFELDENATLWGFSKFYKQGFYEPSGIGIPVVAPEGTIVAEWFQEHGLLVTLFDACDTMFKGCEETVDIFKIMLTEFVENIYQQRTLSKEEIAEKRRVAQEERKTKAVMKLLTSISTAKIATFKDMLANAEEVITRSRRDMLTSLKTKEHALKQLDLFQSDVSVSSEKLLAEFEQIPTMAHIAGYDIAENKIIFMTDTIVMPVNDRYFLAGRYDIEVNVNNAGVRFYNQTPENLRRSVWGATCHHPHVNLEGGPCLGNAMEGIIQCVNSGEWAALASILVAYLESVNLDDAAGKYFYNWDECDAQGVVIRKSNGVDPFKKIVCYDCGAIHTPEDMIVCADTGRTVCKEHAVWLPRYEKYVRTILTLDGKHYITCNKCNEIVAKEDAFRGKCSKCKHEEDDAKAAKEAAKAEKAEKKIKPKKSNSDSAVVYDIPVHNCAICNTEVPENELMICEICGKQGCGGCIGPVTYPVTGANIYTCTGENIYTCTHCATLGGCTTVAEDEDEDGSDD